MEVDALADAIDTVRHAGGGVCELTRLAVTKGADSRSVLSALFGLAYAVGRQLREVTDVFVEVNPRHVAFYRRLFGFVVAAEQRVCPRVMAPAVLLRLEIERLEMRLARIADTARRCPARTSRRPEAWKTPPTTLGAGSRPLPIQRIAGVSIPVRDCRIPRLSVRVYSLTRASQIPP